VGSHSGRGLEGAGEVERAQTGLGREVVEDQGLAQSVFDEIAYSIDQAPIESAGTPRPPRTVKAMVVGQMGHQSLRQGAGLHAVEICAIDMGAFENGGDPEHRRVVDRGGRPDLDGEIRLEHGAQQVEVGIDLE
jgi:hypothetical protein